MRSAFHTRAGRWPPQPKLHRRPWVENLRVLTARRWGEMVPCSPAVTVLSEVYRSPRHSRLRCRLPSMEGCRMVPPTPVPEARPCGHRFLRPACLVFHHGGIKLISRHIQWDSNPQPLPSLRHVIGQGAYVVSCGCHFAIGAARERVGKEGLGPSRSCDHWSLEPARLSSYATTPKGLPGT